MSEQTTTVTDGKKSGKRQLEIPGAEAPVIPELAELAGPYCDALYRRRDLQVVEENLKAQLIERMKSLGHEVYAHRDGSLVFTLKLEEGSVKLKCKREDEDEVE